MKKKSLLGELWNSTANGQFTPYVLQVHYNPPNELMELTLREKQCSLQSPIFCIWLCLQPEQNTTFKPRLVPSAAHFQ